MRRRALAALGLFLACVGCGDPAPAVPELDLAVEFHAFWWSEEQMDGLDPDAPPPKETDVVLTRWEATDPIGVPCPERFRVVARLDNPGDAPAEGPELREVRRWKIGPLDDEARATWTEPERQDAVAVDGAVAAGETRFVELGTVDLDSKQAALFAEGRWPWAFESRIEAATPDSTTRWAETTSVLPIQPAD